MVFQIADVAEVLRRNTITTYRTMPDMVQMKEYSNSDSGKESQVCFPIYKETIRELQDIPKKFKSPTGNHNTSKNGGLSGTSKKCAQEKNRF